MVNLPKSRNNVSGQLSRPIGLPFLFFGKFKACCYFRIFD